MPPRVSPVTNRIMSAWLDSDKKRLEPLKPSRDAFLSQWVALKQEVEEEIIRRE